MNLEEQYEHIFAQLAMKTENPAVPVDDQDYALFEAANMAATRYGLSVGAGGACGYMVLSRTALGKIGVMRKLGVVSVLMSPLHLYGYNEIYKANFNLQRQLTSRYLVNADGDQIFTRSKI